MTREEHLEWAKQRALAYLPDDALQAAASFSSDLDKHDELRGHAVQELMLMHLMSGHDDPDTIRNLITGTN